MEKKILKETYGKQNPPTNLEGSSSSSSTKNVPEKSAKILERSKTRERLYCRLAPEMLKELAENRGWLPPEYFLCKTGVFIGASHSSERYSCTVLVDEVERAKDIIYCSNEEEAKRQIALKALEAILDSSMEGEGDDEGEEMDEEEGPRESEAEDIKIEMEEADEEDDDDKRSLSEVSSEESELDEKKFSSDEDDNPKGPCPIKMLEDLALKKGWKKPNYYLSEVQMKISAEGEMIRYQYSCRVIVNGVEYQPPRHGPRHFSKNKAMRQIAWDCLDKLPLQDLGMGAVKQEPGAEEGERDSDKMEGIDDLNTAFISTCNNSSSRNAPPTNEVEYREIRKSVMISEEQFKVGLEIVSDLKKFVQEHDPDIDVVMFRNWAVQLKTFDPVSAEDEPQVYLHLREELQDPGSCNWLSNAMFDEIFYGGHQDNSEVQGPFSVIGFEPVLEYRDPVRKRKQGPLGVIAKWTIGRQSNVSNWKMLHKPTGATFSLTSLKSYLLEVQTWRLLQYLCTFDIRCHHLITLGQYWAGKNAICFEDRKQTSDKLDSFCPQHVMPEMMTLPWLVILFLCHRGILPTPREIQERPHKVLKDPVTGIDIGFSPDPEFIKTWKSPNSSKITRMIPGEGSQEGLSLQILQLFEEFLRSLMKGSVNYGGSNRSWLLNTKDGEWIDKNNLFSSPPISPGVMTWMTNMKINEIYAVRDLSIPDKHWQKRMDMLESIPWYMTNPFIVTSRLPVAKGITYHMRFIRYSCTVFGKYLKKISDSDKNISENLGTLVSVLVVDEDLRKKIIKGKLPSVSSQRRKRRKKMRREMRKAMKAETPLELD